MTNSFGPTLVTIPELSGQSKFAGKRDLQIGLPEKKFLFSRTILLRVLLLFPVLLLVLRAIAGAQVGKRNFIEPLIVEDPDPSNELDLIPNWVAPAEGSNFSFNFTLEKEISQNLSIELGNAWNDPSCNPGFICIGAGSSRRGRSRNQQANSNNSSQQVLTGFDDLEVLPKFAFYRSDEHETRLAIGLDSFLPIGNETAGATTHASAGPILMFARGLGDIPIQAPQNSCVHWRSRAS